MSINYTKNCSVSGLLHNFKTLLLAVLTVTSFNVFAQTSSVSSCDDFVAGSGSAWPFVLEAALVADGASSLEAQTFTMNVTSLPDGGANFRIFKTTPTGNYFGNLTALQLGLNTFTVAAYTGNAADFTARAVKFQFSNGEVEFDALSVNDLSAACLPEPTSSTVEFCSDFVAGPSAWPFVLEAAVVTDGASSLESQTFTMNVISLPDGGANFRIFKTTPTGNYFGNLTALQLGVNTFTVAAYTGSASDFTARAVKFQFSSGDIEFDALSVNGVNSDCVPQPSTSVVGDCDLFSEGPNTTWTHVLTSCVSGDGNTGEAQTITINITSLPDGGAQSRVVKSTANGNWFNAPASDLSLGSNTINVNSVSFTRTVKFQFSSGDIEFDALSVNGSEVSCDSQDDSSVDVAGCTDDMACNFDASATSDDGSCTYADAGLDCDGNCLADADADGVCDGDEVVGCQDATACNYDASATDAGDCTFADAGFDCSGNCLEGETLVMNDSWGDGWNGNALTINGVDYTIDYGSSSVVCVPAADCYIMSWTMGSYSNETSWSFMGQTGSFGSTPENMGACVTDCMDPVAENYNADAHIADNSLCTYSLVQGCTDSTACNFDAAAEQDNGSCTYPMAAYYDCAGELLDGAGCTDMLACNYDSTATIDDESCTFAVEGFDCEGSCLSGVNVVYSPSFYPGENSFTITDCDGNILAEMGSGYTGFNECVVLPELYFVNLDDSYGDGWDIGSLSIGDVSYSTDGYSESFAPNGDCPNVIYTAGSYAGENSFTITDCDGNVLASMESGNTGFSGAVELPENYNISLVDSYGDGWNGGTLSVDGVDYTASGFGEDFLVGSCGLPGCTDATACNYNDSAAVDDGSCYYSTATVDCDGNCIVGSAVTISLTDSYGDSWNGGSLNVFGVEYTQVGSYGWPYTAGATETFTACVDLDTCTFVTYTAGSYSYENSWSITDADGNELASGGNEDGYLGCPSGCTNPLANNFDIEAVVEDGSCLVCIDGEEVSDANLPLGVLPDDVITITITAGDPPFAYSGEIHWELYNNGNDLIMSGGNALTVGDTESGGFAGGDYDDGEVYTRTSGCLPDGCYKLITYDTYGDGWNNNGSFGVTNQFGSVLVPTTVMGPNVGFDEDGMGYGGYPQQLATYFVIGDASCETYGCTDELASNYDVEATVDDETCIFCDEGSVDVTFAFNQENVTSDEVYVYNQETNDTVFSVEPFELATWAGKDSLTCVPVGCYIVSMGATSSAGWTDGSQLQILDDLTADYFFLEVDGGALDLQLVSIGGAVCTDAPIGGCMDSTYDNYNPEATYDNGSCAYTCENAVASNTASVEEDAESAPFSFVTSDVAGFGATVTFEVTESDADLVYHVADCDSTQLTSFSPNSLSIEVGAGVSVYFAALDAWNTDSVGTIVATVNELPDTIYWGCMEELACNYDSTATYQPTGFCVYAEVGFACDGTEFPVYYDVELDYTTSGDICNFTDNYNDVTVGSDYPNASWTNDGGDIGYAFVSDGNPVSVSVTTVEAVYDGQLNVYNGNPLDTLPSTLVANEYVSNDFSINTIFETDSGSTYFVILDSDNWDCYEYELSINSLEGVGGCTDSIACNYNDSADYDDFSCTYAAAGFDCDGAFIGSACGTDNPMSDSIVVGTGYANNMYEVYVYPSDGVNPVSIAWTSGDTENNYDEFAIYDGIGDVIYGANLITEIEDNLAGQYVSGTGNGITMVWSSDGSVNGDESFGNLVWDVYCANFIYGCLDELAMNFDSTANMADNDLCIYDFTYGCIDTLACNYADTADVDDGSCFYAEEGFDCDGLCLNGSNITLSLFDSYGDGWNGGTLEVDGVVYTGTGNLSTFELCIDLDVCTDVIYTAGSWSSENSWSVSDASGVLMSAGNVSGQFGNCGVFGCTDSTATNFNVEATLEDGTCEYPVTYAVELDHTSSGDLCNHANDYDETNTAYDPGFSSYMGGEDNAYYFTADNGVVEISMVQEEDGTGQPGVFVFDGDPLDTLSSLVASQTGFSGGDITMSFESNDSTTYYVVVDHLATWGCFAYDLTLTQVYSGCMDSLALNYDPMATIDDGSCEFDFVYGCIDSLACNFADTADVDDGSCFYPASDFVDCDGNCLYSTVTVALSESYGDNTNATVSVNGDVVVGPGVGSNTACVDLDGCVSFVYNGNGEYFTNEDSWTVTVDSVVVIDGGGYSTSWGTDTMQYGASCPIAGCTDELACNFDSIAEVDNGSCTFAEEGYDCDGLCLVDTDADGICDEFEVAGCTDQTAVNYDPSATDDDGSCEACQENAITLVMNDTYGDGWNGATFTMESDENSISASNYPTASTSSEELCVPDGCYEVTVGGGAYDYEITFSLGDLLSDVQSGTYTNIVVGADSLACEVFGCMDTTATNFNADATMDDGTCTYPTYSLTVSVDMSIEGFTAGDGSTWDGLDGSSMAIRLNGGTWAAMTDMGDNVWSYTFTDLVAGDYTYNFNDGWYESGGYGDCAGGQYGNDRLATITDADVTIPTVCWESCEACPDVILGCTDATANNYDATATEDDGSCTYPAPMVNLFFSEYAEGSSNNKYLEIYNPSDVTVSLADYAYPNVSNAPSTVGEYEYWNTFDEGAEIAANSVYIIAHGSSDPSILALANETHNYLSNGDDGYALAYGSEDDYVILDHIGNFEGDPGSGWDVAGVSNATKDHTLVRKCGITQGNADWTASAGTNEDDSEWIVLEQNDWTNLGVHEVVCPLPSTTFNVDMSCSGIEFTTVHLTGPIWGWTTDIIMTDEDGDGVYSITMEGLEGDVEYKYMVDYWAGQEDLIDDMVNGATCAPITDYSSYANRQVAAGSTTADTYGSCDACGTAVLGCTDEAASNYNPAATEDDGTCDYCDAVTVNFSVDAGNVVSGDYDNVVINGSFASWNGWGVTLTDEDGDGVYTGSATVEANITHEYVHALTGAADGWSGWGVIGYAPEECQLGVSETTGDASPNYYFSGECGEVIDLPTVCFGSCVECVVDVPGCTDASADNFDPNATIDDGSCTFCNSFEAVLLGTSDASAAGASDGSVQATGTGGSNDYSISVQDANGVEQNPFALAAGDYTVTVTDVVSGCVDSESFTIAEPVVAEEPCDIVPSGLFVNNIIHNRITFNWSAPSAAPSHYMIRYRVVGTSSWTVMTAGPVNSNEFNGTSRTRYFMEPGTTYEWSMRARVLNEDGSTNCQSSWSANSEYTTLPACANLENLSVSNVEANWVTFSADAPDASWGVWQSKGKMRELGTNAYRYVNGGSDGSISSVLKGNFTPSTDYEWHTKSWCTGNVDADGNPDPQYHSGWGDFSAFSTEAPCDKMPTNLTTSSNGANTAVIMSWDTPESGAPDHYFLEMTNLTTGAVYEWNYQDGNSNSRTKFGQNPGDEISWRIRGACGTNGTSWATIFSQPVTYTLGGARLENNSVANLDVYPNPSRDIFNVTFTSEEAQTMTVKVVNMIGEEIFTEELTEFVGQYTKVIDMNTQPKGVYFLEITTSTGGINKKIVLQ